MTRMTSTAIGVSQSALRAQLARWPTGVAVITATGLTRPIGKTVNSFHATSLEPPLVGWCIDRKSSQFDEWMAAEGYVVHVLASDQACLMSHFARPATDRFQGIDWTPGLDGMPVLAEPVPIRIECRVTQRLPAGDHSYLVGQVITMTAADGVPMSLPR
jgi:flavin reductase (DIM6/NTAB) family NADH-FMN oxidoreductase RutF